MKWASCSPLGIRMGWGKLGNQSQTVNASYSQWLTSFLCVTWQRWDWWRFFFPWVRVQCPGKSRRRCYCASSYSWLVLISWGHYSCSKGQLQELLTWPSDFGCKGNQTRGGPHRILQLISLGSQRELRFLQKAVMPKHNTVHLNGCSSVHRHPEIFLNYHHSTPLISHKRFKSILNCLENAGLK